MDICIKELCKSYGDNRVIDGFSAVFPEGDTTCIMGRSGCGKTTLLNILMGLVRPDSGSITGLPSEISAVFQENRLFDGFTAEENLKAVLKDKSRNVLPGLEALGLGDSVHLPVSEMSGGMKRRVAILRALEYGGSLYIMDEPFKGLDETTKKTVIAYIRKTTAGKTLIIVTHDPEEAELLGGKILIMGDKE